MPPGGEIRSSQSTTRRRGAKVFPLVPPPCGYRLAVGAEGHTHQHRPTNTGLWAFIGAARLGCCVPAPPCRGENKKPCGQGLAVRLKATLAMFLRLRVTARGFSGSRSRRAVSQSTTPPAWFLLYPAARLLPSGLKATLTKQGSSKARESCLGAAHVAAASQSTTLRRRRRSTRCSRGQVPLPSRLKPTPSQQRPGHGQGFSRRQGVARRVPEHHAAVGNSRCTLRPGSCRRG